VSDDSPLEDLVEDFDTLAAKAEAAAKQLVENFASTWGSDISGWETMFTQARYGCWCGPGNVCDGEQDAMDTCCHHHDLAYDALGLAFASMWTFDAMKTTLSADETLIACVEASEPAEEVGKVYRDLLLTVMKGRVLVTQWLLEQGS
jgi:hypothetical protein